MKTGLHPRAALPNVELMEAHAWREGYWQGIIQATLVSVSLFGSYIMLKGF